MVSRIMMENDADDIPNVGDRETSVIREASSAQPVPLNHDGQLSQMIEAQRAKN